MVILKTKKLDAARFEEAWHKTIENHDMLRAIVTKEGQQYIKNSVELPMLEVYVTDAENIEESDTEKNIRAELEGYDFKVDSWPMHRIILHQGVNESIVHFCTDMLIADYISINVVLEDIFSWYENGEFLHAGKGKSFKETVEENNKAAGSRLDLSGGSPICDCSDHIIVSGAGTVFRCITPCICLRHLYDGVLAETNE